MSRRGQERLARKVHRLAPRSLLLLCVLQHFFRVGKRLRRDFHAAEHARDFIDAIFRVEHGDVGTRLAVARLFLHGPMLLTLRGDLRQMRNAQNLPVLRQRPQTPPDNFRHTAADTGIDFIKSQI